RRASSGLETGPLKALKRDVFGIFVNEIRSPALLSCRRITEVRLRAGLPPHLRIPPVPGVSMAAPPCRGRHRHARDVPRTGGGVAEERTAHRSGLEAPPARGSNH